MWFLVILLLLPIAEVMVFAAVVERIGFLPALLLCVLTSMIGSTLLQSRGLAALMAAQRSLRRHEAPARALFDSMAHTLAGILLILPGFITDILGFLLLTPPVRYMLRAQAERYFDDKGHKRDPDVIEGEFTRIEPEELADKESSDQS